MHSPPLPAVLSEHVANAAQLLAMLRGVRDARVTPDAVTAWAMRCDANLDGLRVAGAAGLAAAHDAVGDEPDAAAVLALLLAEWAPAEPSLARAAVALLHDDAPDIRHAAWWGLRLAPVHSLEPQLGEIAERGTWTAARAAALDLLAFHRRPVGTPIPEPPDEEGDEIAWLLAEAGGRTPGAWTASHLARYLAHDSPRVREAALRASARCGLPEVVPVCRAAVEGSCCPEAVSFLGVVGGESDLPILQRAATEPAVATAAVEALGRLGIAAALPSLLYFLDVPALAESAVGAIARITGQEVPRDEAPPPPGLTDDELDLWESDPPVDVAGERRWWQAHARHFDPARRYQYGLCVSDDPLGAVFDQLPMNARCDVYLRHRALVLGTPDWELETWPWRQRNPGG
jgi:hypothetical protein